MPKKPSNLLYGVDDRPPLHISVILALQHIIFLTASLIFVTMVMRQIGCDPALIQNVICMSTIVGGLATILQALNT